ncbi:hypothetical protein RCH07_003216 [Arthrobacter sp. CG_A4]|nr:hypothetical protein [Arthrobacter sp. CG_A4]
MHFLAHVIWRSVYVRMLGAERVPLRANAGALGVAAGLHAGQSVSWDLLSAES